MKEEMMIITSDYGPQILEDESCGMWGGFQLLCSAKYLKKKMPTICQLSYATETLNISINRGTIGF